MTAGIPGNRLAIRALASPSHPVPRLIALLLRRRLASCIVVFVTGSRQSGKTTLARSVATDATYLSLEEPDTRAFATEDPRGILRQLAPKTILDKLQRCSSLFTYLQDSIDADPRPGRHLLTGSSQFGRTSAITQSLAGRAGMLTLLPFSQAELQGAGCPPATVDLLLQGGLIPLIQDRSISAADWLQDYVGTYVEQDVCQILRIQDPASFQRCLSLCAGWIG